MTAVAAGRPDTRGSLRLLGPGDEGLLLPLLRRDPVTHCLTAARVADAGLTMAGLGGYILGYQVGDELTSALMVSANLVPIDSSPDSRQEFARHLRERRRRSSCIVGPHAEVLDLWRLLEPAWGPAREERPDQPLMVARQPATVAPDPRVRRVRPAELSAVLPSFIAMFTEELGVSPVANGAEGAYRSRVAEIIASGAAYARFDGDQLIFKAELGAITPECAQIQGVWVHPDYRGRGLAGPAMAAVVQLATEHSRASSLYVNQYNQPALRAYQAAGFETVGEFASVLF